MLLSDGRIYSVGENAVTEEADLTAGQHGFQGILGASDDLSSVYFIDTAALTGGEKNAKGATAQAGQNNLYLSHGGSLTFVATLAGGDDATNLINYGPGSSSTRATGQRPHQRAPRTSRRPDGSRRSCHLRP